MRTQSFGLESLESERSAGRPFVEFSHKRRKEHSPLAIAEPMFLPQDGVTAFPQSCHTNVTFVVYFLPSNVSKTQNRNALNRPQFSGLGQL